ncbi:MAG: 50S ribosomal protein L25 [Parcubacteria group bacterium]
MEKIKLDAKLREERGKRVNKGRKSGLIPAVTYGKGADPQSLWVDALEFGRLIKKSGESIIINLSIGGKNGYNVLIHELQQNPVNGSISHIDFYQVKMDEKIETEVELVFIGESPAVKEMGGVLVKSLDNIEISCLPADLPSSIEVDIATIKTFDDHIYVKDLKISKGVEVKDDPETVVALVTPPRSEEELSELEEKVVEDVTKVEGVVKEEPAIEGEEKSSKADKPARPEEKKEKKE